MALAVAGCSSDKSWAAKAGDQTISAGVYILNVMSGLTAASAQVDPEADFDTALIEGESTNDFILNYAKDETARQVTIHSKFEELGLVLSEADVTEYKSYAQQMYDQDTDLYKSNGVTLEAVEYANRISLETFKVFEKLYGIDGEFGYTEEIAKTFFAENFYLAQVVAIPKIDGTTGAPLSEEALAEAKTLAETYLKEIQEGKNIVDVIYAEGMKTLPEGTPAPERGEDAEYQMVIDKKDNGSYYPLSLSTHLATAENNSIALVEDEIFHLIIQKVDSNTISTEISMDYYAQLLPSVKGEEYIALVEEWATATEMTYNEDAINEYSPKKVKDTTDAYIKKMMEAMGEQTTTPQLSVPSIDEAESNAEAEGETSESASVAE